MVRSSSKHLALTTLAVTLALLGGIARPAHAQGFAFPAPAPPSDVVVYPQAKAVFLSWTHLPDATLAGYNVYRRTADQTADKAALVNTAGPITTTYLSDTSAMGGTAYTYNVKSVYKDAAGKLTESVPTNDVPGCVGDVGPFALYNLDTAYVGSASVDANSIMTIKASGQDIWATQNQGMFLLAPVSGNFRITVKVAERPKLVDDTNGDPAAKVGLVWLPGGLHRTDNSEFAYYYNSVMRDPEFLMEGRKPDLSDWGVSDNSPTSDATTFPAYLRYTWKAPMLTASFSEDNGKTFMDLGPAVDMSGSAALPTFSYAGIGVTARKDGQYVIGKIDLTTLKIEAAP
jgi:hypothetical protein